jgi:hypothetical protein
MAVSSHVTAVGPGSRRAMDRDDNEIDGGAGLLQSFIIAAAVSGTSFSLGGLLLFGNRTDTPLDANVVMIECSLDGRSKSGFLDVMRCTLPPFLEGVLFNRRSLSNSSLMGFVRTITLIWEGMSPARKASNILDIFARSSKKTRSA